MIVAFAIGTDAHFGAERSRDLRVARDRFFIVEVSVADAVDVGRGSPAVKRHALVSPMRRGSISAIRADKNWRVDFAAKIFEVTRQREDRARDVVWKLPQKQFRFARINRDQFRQGKMARDAQRMRLLPARHFEEKPRQMMNSAVLVAHRFAGAKRGPMFCRECQTIDGFHAFTSAPVNVWNTIPEIFAIVSRRPLVSAGTSVSTTRMYGSRSGR